MHGADDRVGGTGCEQRRSAADPQRVGAKLQRILARPLARRRLRPPRSPLARVKCTEAVDTRILNAARGSQSSRRSFGRGFELFSQGSR